MTTTSPHDPQNAKRRALGRGLEALLPSRSTPVAAPVAPPEPTGKAFEIALDLIDRNPFQTRTHFDEAKLAELAASIAATGVIQPVLVRPGGEGRYTLITGERRVLASRQAGKQTIPAIVRELSDTQAMESTIVENLQRADLNPMEQARAFHRLSHDFKMTQEQMATRTGKDRASISNFLRLLRLPDSVQSSLESGELTFGHGRALLGLESEAEMTAVASKVLALHLSVRATENMVANILNPEAKNKLEKAAKPPLDPNVREAQDSLCRSLGLKVTIEDKRGRGKVIIEYSGVEDFDAILTALGERPAA